MDEQTKLPGVTESRWALRFEVGCRQIGFFFLLAIVFLAIGGFFSNGYFSKTNKVLSDNSLKIEYERFGRLQTEFNVKISVAPVPAGKYVIALGGDFNDGFEMGNIWPTPDKMYSEKGSLILVYETSQPGQPFTVWMYTTPTSPGTAHNTIQVNAGSAMHFWQFIYP